MEIRKTCSMIGTALNLQIALGSILIFTILILLIHEHCIFLHLLVSSLISFTSVLQFSNWFQIGKGVCQGRILCPDSFIFYAVYNMRNAGLKFPRIQGIMSLTSTTIKLVSKKCHFISAATTAKQWEQLSFGPLFWPENSQDPLLQSKFTQVV